MEKRFYLGLFLLAVLLAIGLLTGWAAERGMEPVAEHLTQATQAILNGDFTAGARLARQAKATWQSRWRWLAAVADHAPMDEIDGLFSQAEYYVNSLDKTRLGACCAQLSELVEAIADAHRLNWWNIL